MSSKLVESKKLAAEIYLEKSAGFLPYISIQGELSHRVSTLGKPYTRCDWYLHCTKFSLAEASICFERDIARWESAGRPDMREWSYGEVMSFYKTDDEEGEEYMKIIRRFGFWFTGIPSNSEVIFFEDENGNMVQR